MTSSSNPNLFNPVTFYISDTLKPTIRSALRDLLIEAAARPCPALDVESPLADTARPPRFDPAQLTHFITDTLDFQEYSLLRPDNHHSSLGNGTNGHNKVHGKGKGKQSAQVPVGTDEKRVEIVSPAWVTRSYDLQALQPPRFYSASRSLFFSGTVICTSDFPEADNLAIAGAVEAFGGQFRRELTREVTHLICIAEQGPKYEMAMKFGTELGMVVVLPHWFEESLKLAQLVPLDIYRFPSPPFSTTLRDGSSSKPFAERLHTYWQTRLSSTASTSSSATFSPGNAPTTATHVILGGVSPTLASSGETDTYLRQSLEVEAPNGALRSTSVGPFGAGVEGGGATGPVPVIGSKQEGGGGGRDGIFKGKKVYLASDLGLSATLERALKGAVKAAGGECWGFGVDGEREGERGGVKGKGERTDAWAKRRRAERELREAGLVVMRTREGWEYWTAFDLSIPLASLSYLYHCLSTSSLPSPLSRLLHYPLPSLDGVPAFRGKTITVSNYAGPARDYVRAMIEVLGGKFEGTMGRGTDFVVSASEYGSKVSHARTWSIPLVTHLWLEACLQTWSLIPPSLSPAYILSSSSSSSSSAAQSGGGGGGGGASETHFTTILGTTGWTRGMLEEWAERDEVSELREVAMRGVDELEREAELEMEESARLYGEGEGEGEGGRDGRVSGGDVEMEVEVDHRQEEAVMPPPPPVASTSASAAAAATKKQSREARAQSTVLVSDTLALAQGSEKQKDKVKKGKQRAVDEDEDQDEEDQDQDENEGMDPVKSTSKAKKAKTAATARSTSPVAQGGPSKPPSEISKATNGALPAPAETPKPAKKKIANASKRKRGESGSSPLSSDHSSSSSSEASPPPSANRFKQTHASISSDNLVVRGRRNAATAAGKKLSVAMEDRNMFEAELKSSARKGKGGSQGDGIGMGRGRGRRSASPSKKKGTGKKKEEEDEEDEETGGKEKDEGEEEEEAEELVKKSKKRPPKDVEPKSDDDDEPHPPPPKKKAKTATAKPPAAAPKALKVVQASAGGATTQEGAVSSFDNPPRAKPVPVKSGKIKIISTGLGLDKNSKEIKSLKSLGASWTDQPKDATHLVVKGISRTEKFLCCLPFAPKIVTKSWIDACIAASRLVDEMPYLLRDEKKEAEIDDKLDAILARARKGKLFEGKNVYVTKDVKPDQQTMQRIISACGGTVHTIPLTKMTKKISDNPNALIISCADDRRQWEHLAAAPLKKKIYAVEAVFVAVLHQDLKRGFVRDHRVDMQLND
ncbi:hypothetical protein JCM11641_004129 [Rhodosporidiobolus odoratus]